MVHSRPLLPLYASAVFVQAVVPVARVATSYKAITEGLSPIYVGILSAAFAVLPIFLAVLIGRFNDKGGATNACLLGAVFIAAACVALRFTPASMPFLLAATSLLGVGQTLQLTSLQAISTRISSRSHRDRVVGNFTVAASLGQALGPLLIGVLGTDNTAVVGDQLIAECIVGALFLMGLGVVLKLTLPPQRGTPPDSTIPLRTIMATNGLFWIIVAGSLCVTAQDLLLVFVPVLGIERAIAVSTVGFMLGARAFASMASRLLFMVFVKRFGRLRVMLWATVITGASIAVLGVPAIPEWGMWITLCASGFGLGLAVTCSISLTLMIAPSYARATALSLRLTANRIGQFLIPLGAGGVAASLGSAGIFLIIGASLAAVAAVVPRSLRTLAA